ncbi:phosphoglycolate phosphatase, bacterial [Streptomyces longispororuber]|uniref:Tyrosine-protein kinase PtkA n=1 Tax=Streptomyces longispororuber TaxID=68230 RepID=A0A918ZF10_9ACTN|nr:HAD family hydrolase [Streptomyces longispororuber]GHE49685.1 phosphoglycolate phosphatase, bacterial [Streptomyces longispororuber]
MADPHTIPYRGVVFDLDGTLADTPGAIVSITLQVLRGLGREADDAAVRATVGKPLDRNFAQLLDLPADHSQVLDAMAAYRSGFGEYLAEHRERMLYPGVPEGLTKLRDLGHTLAVATSKTYEAAVRTMDATGILGQFTVIAGHDSVSRGKPAPDMALYLAEELGIPAEECVVVGDATGDIEMARAAGMASIGVSYGVATAQDLMAAGALAIADSFDSVVSAVSRGGGE